jgi:dTDP-4-dehydrorhamnose reductase
MKKNELVKETILVTGSSGFLGGAIARALRHRYKVIGVSRTDNVRNSFQLDLTSQDRVYELSKVISPTIIIHAAGLKDIQLCEDDPKLAESANIHMVRNISKFFPASKIIYMSTDYVFSGDVGMYSEVDIPNPITVYGKTKYQGELVGKEIAGKNFKVVRTASVFSNNSSFMKFLKFRIENNLPVDSYSDCIFSPTYFFDLVATIEKIIVNDPDCDVFHSAGGAISRYSFAKAYFEAGSFDKSGLLKCENNGENIYLYKDLSLDGSRTENLLGLKPTPLTEAFAEILR